MKKTLRIAMLAFITVSGMIASSLFFSVNVFASTSYISNPYSPNASDIGYTYAHRNGSVSVASCDTSQQNTAPLKTWGSDRSNISAIPRSTDGWSPNCGYGDVATGGDSMVYRGEYKYSNNSFLYRLAAYKRGVLIWTKEADTCTANAYYSGKAMMAYPTLGASNTLYYLAISPPGCSPSTQDNKLYAVDASTGEVKSGFVPASLGIVNNNNLYVTQSPHIFPYDNGVVVFYEKSAKFFDLSGMENVAKRTDVTMQSSQTVLRSIAAGTHRAYFELSSDSLPTANPTNPATPCTNDTEFVRLDFTSGNVDRVANDDCKYRLNSIAATPDGGVVALAGDASYSSWTANDLLVKFAANGDVDYESPVREISSSFNNALLTTSITVDSLGNTYVVSVAAENSGDADKHLIIRKYATSGAQSIIYTTEDAGTTAQDNFRPILAEGDAKVTNGTLYMGFCKLGIYSNYCGSATDNRLVKIDDASIGDAYPQSEVTAQNSVLADYDQDGLTLGLENAQDTLDVSSATKDTDHDGISDLKESTLYPNRDSSYCGLDFDYTQISCSYPNPSVKDLYVEIDWMIMPDGEHLRPESSSINALTAAYSQKGITAHFDIGQFGGGRPVAYNSPIAITRAEPSANIYDDYKNDLTVGESFDKNNRSGIWRYMIVADRLVEGGNSSGLYGLSYPGDDDNLIAYGELKANYSFLAQTGLEKTIIHELGHDMCLTGSSPRYPELLSQGCVFSKIDSTTLSVGDYDSVMHYENAKPYPYSGGLRYSDGSHSADLTNDHNDWQAIYKGMDDFTTIQGMNIE